MSPNRFHSDRARAAKVRFDQPMVSSGQLARTFALFAAIVFAALAARKPDPEGERPELRSTVAPTASALPPASYDVVERLQ